jgi:hypothetical protein
MKKISLKNSYEHKHIEALHLSDKYLCKKRIDDYNIHK